jgi:hypothetical protein
MKWAIELQGEQFLQQQYCEAPKVEQEYWAKKVMESMLPEWLVNGLDGPAQMMIAMAGAQKLEIGGFVVETEDSAQRSLIYPDGSQRCRLRWSGAMGFPQVLEAQACFPLEKRWVQVCFPRSVTAKELTHQRGY